MLPKPQLQTNRQRLEAQLDALYDHMVTEEQDVNGTSLAGTLPHPQRSTIQLLPPIRPKYPPAPAMLWSPQSNALEQYSGGHPSSPTKQMGMKKSVKHKPNALPPFMSEPKRPQWIPKGVVATTAHLSQCVICHTNHEKFHRISIEKLCQQEAVHREQIVKEEIEIFWPLNDNKIRWTLKIQSDKHREFMNRVERDQNRRRRIEDLAKVLATESLQRRDISTEYDNDCDDLMNFHTVSVRTAQVMLDVMKKHEEKFVLQQQQAEEERLQLAALREQRAQEAILTTFFEQESDERAATIFEGDCVWEALLLSFQGVKKSVWRRHREELTRKRLLEERERLHNQQRHHIEGEEKKHREFMDQNETRFRQNMMRDQTTAWNQVVQATELRKKTERLARKEIEDGEYAERSATETKSIKVLWNLSQLETEEREKLVMALEREKVKRGRVAFRKNCEVVECKLMAEAHVSSILLEHAEHREAMEEHETATREHLLNEEEYVWANCIERNNSFNLNIVLGRDSDRLSFFEKEVAFRNILQLDEYPRHLKDLRALIASEFPMQDITVSQNIDRALIDQEEQDSRILLDVAHRNDMHAIHTILENAIRPSPEGTVIQNAVQSIQLSQNVVEYVLGTLPISLLPNVACSPNECPTSVSASIKILNPFDGDTVPQNISTDSTSNMSKWLSTAVTFSATNNLSVGDRYIQITIKARQKTLDIIVVVNVQAPVSPLIFHSLDDSGIPVVSTLRRPVVTADTSKITFAVTIDNLDNVDDGVLHFMSTQQLNLTPTGDLMQGKTKICRVLGAGTSCMFIEVENLALFLPKWDEVMSRIRYRSDAPYVLFASASRVARITCSKLIKKKNQVSETNVGFECSGQDPTAKLSLWVRRLLVSTRMQYTTIPDNALSYIQPMVTRPFSDASLSMIDDEIHGGRITLHCTSGAQVGDKFSITAVDGITCDDNTIYYHTLPIATYTSESPLEISIEVNRMTANAAEAIIRSLGYSQVASTLVGGTRVCCLTVSLSGMASCTRSVQIRVDDPLIPTSIVTSQFKESVGVVSVLNTGCEIKETDVLKFHRDATITCRFIEGEEFGDEIRVKGAVESSGGMMRFDAERAPLVFFRPYTRGSPFVLYFSLSNPNVGSSQTDLTPLDAEGSRSLMSLSTNNFITNEKPLSKITHSRVNALLKMIQYNHKTRAASIEKKTMMIDITDGVGNSTILFVLIALELANDPTEIDLPNAVLEYRQNSVAVTRGVSLFPSLRLFDVDTHDFSKGYICVDLVNGGDGGDAIGFLRPPQQRDVVDAEHAMYASRKLKDMCFEKSPFWDVVIAAGTSSRAFNLDVSDDDILSVNGRPRGKVTRKTNGTKDSHPISIRVDFSSVAQTTMLPIEEVTHIIRCISYENTSAKVKSGNRTYQLALHANDDTSTRKPAPESKTKMTVRVGPPLLQIQTTSFVYSERSGFKPVLRGATFGMPETTILSNIFIAVTIEDSMDPADVLGFLPEYEVIQDTLVHVPTQTKIAAIQCFESTTLQISFNQSFATTAKDAGNALRAVCFGNDSRDPAKGRRFVQCLASDGDDFLLKIELLVETRDDPTEVRLSQETLTYVLAAPPLPVASGCIVDDPDTPHFDDPTTLEVTFGMKGGKPIPGERFGLVSSPALQINTLQPGVITFVDAGRPVAILQEMCVQVDGAILLNAKTLSIRILHATLDQLAAIISSITYHAVSKLDKCVKRQICFTLRTIERTTCTRFSVTVCVIPQPLDLKVYDKINSTTSSDPMFPLSNARTVLTSEPGIENIHVVVSIVPPPSIVEGREYFVYQPVSPWKVTETGEVWNGKSLVANIRATGVGQITIKYVSVATLALQQGLMKLVGVAYPMPVTVGSRLDVTLRCSNYGSSVSYQETIPFSDDSEVCMTPRRSASMRNRAGSAAKERPRIPITAANKPSAPTNGRRPSAGTELSDLIGS
eukprot:PhF_6_TR26647/c0_g1_i2/m.38625